MASASSAITKAGETASKRPKALLEKRREQWAAKRHSDSVERVSEGFLDKPWSKYMTKEGFLKSGKAYLYPVDKFRSGAWDPTQGRVKAGSKNAEKLGPFARILTSEEGGWRRQKSLDKYIKEGEDEHQKDLAETGYRLRRDWEHLDEEGYTKDDYLQDLAWGKRMPGHENNVYRTTDGRILDPENHTAIEREAAKLEMLKLSGGTNMRHFEAMFELANLGSKLMAIPEKDRVDKDGKLKPEVAEYMSRIHALSKGELFAPDGTVDAAGNPAGFAGFDKATGRINDSTLHHLEDNYSTFRKFMSDNVGTLIAKMTVIYKGAVSTSDAGAKTISEMHGVGVEAEVAQIISRLKKARASGNKDAEAAAQDTLTRFLRGYMEAASNDQYKGSLEPGGIRLMKALVADPDRMIEVTENGQKVQRPLREVILENINGTTPMPTMPDRNDPQFANLSDADFDKQMKSYDKAIKEWNSKTEDSRKRLGLLQIDIDAIQPGDISPELREELDTLIRDDPNGGIRTPAELKAIREAKGQQPPPDEPGTSTVSVTDNPNTGLGSGGAGNQTVQRTGSITNAPGYGQRDIFPDESPYMHGPGEEREYTSPEFKLDKGTIREIGKAVSEGLGEHMAEQTKAIKESIPRTADDVTRNDLPSQTPPPKPPTTPPEEPTATS